MENAVKSDLSASVGETSQQCEKQDFSHTPFSNSKCHHHGIMCLTLDRSFHPEQQPTRPATLSTTACYTATNEARLVIH